MNQEDAGLPHFTRRSFLYERVKETGETGARKPAPGAEIRPSHATLPERPWGRPLGRNRNQKGLLAGCRQQAVNKRTTSREQGCFEKAAENGLCDVSCFRG